MTDIERMGNELTTTLGMEEPRVIRFWSAFEKEDWLYCRVIYTTWKKNQGVAHMTREEIIARAKQMHQEIIDLKDDEIYEIWIYVMPDEPTEEDFEWFADTPEDWAHLQRLYNRLISRN